jgi:SEC-C motif-containing protein
MRSRYSAHVLVRIDYLIATHDPATRAALDRAAIERWARDSVWLGLDIVARERGDVGDEDGIVEFRASYRASYRAGDADLVHHERSRFGRRQGRWVYLDGDAVRPTPARRAVAAGRNDPCPCGSGHNYKRCCGR